MIYKIYKISKLTPHKKIRFVLINGYVYFNSKLLFILHPFITIFHILFSIFICAMCMGDVWVFETNLVLLWRWFFTILLLKMLRIFISNVCWMIRNKSSFYYRKIVHKMGSLISKMVEDFSRSLIFIIIFKMLNLCPPTCRTTQGDRMVSWPIYLWIYTALKIL